MNTKEFVTPFGSILHLDDSTYNHFVLKFKKLEEQQPKEYNLKNGKEIVNHWFSDKTPEDIVREIYG